MATIAQLNEDIETALGDLTEVFKSFYLCSADLKDAMQDRIFAQSRGTDGQELPTKPYSTDPIYVEQAGIIRSLGSYQVGKTGKKIKSAYLPGGYAQLKQVLGRPPLELTGFLFRDFVNTPQVDNFDKVLIEVDEVNADKIASLESNYGEIFFPTETELDDLVDCLENRISNDFNA